MGRQIVVVAEVQIPEVGRTTVEARARTDRRDGSRAWVASAVRCNASAVDQTASEAVVAARKCDERQICGAKCRKSAATRAESERR